MAFRPWVIFLAICACLIAGFAQAQQNMRIYENPPIAQARMVLGHIMMGPNYQVRSQVYSDGFLNIYVLNTKYGQFTVSGTELLKARLRELAALRVLEKTDEAKTFAKGVVKSAVKPLNLATGIVRAPDKAVGKMVSGVGSMFSRIASGVTNMGKSPDNIVDSFTGTATARRQIAVKLGVDPYSDFKPFTDRLYRIATASALGEITVSIGTAQIGAIGSVLSYSMTAQDLSNLIANKTPSELLDINRGKLQKMRVRQSVIAGFLDNKYYTITDKTAIVLALERLDGVTNKELFVARAARARRRDLSYFLRRRAEMLSFYHARKARLASFINAAGFPLNRRRDGRVLVLAPLDRLVWTKTTHQAFAAITADLKRRNLIDGAILQMTGRATMLARKNMTKLGWTLVQNAHR